MIFCSFCGTGHEDEPGTAIFEGPRVAICADCVLMALRVMLKGWEKGEPDGTVIEGSASRPLPPIPGPSDADYGDTFGAPV